MPVFFLMYECEPTPDHAEAGTIGGAYINCYVEAPGMIEAEQVALPQIESMYWRVIGLEESYELKREHFEEGSEELAYFNKALLDKTVFIVNAFPGDDDDDDDM